MDRNEAKAQVKHNLTNHAPSEGAVLHIEHVREVAKKLGYAIIDDCPDSREKSLALTNLEQTAMWAVAAIARNQE